MTRGSGASSEAPTPDPCIFWLPKSQPLAGQRTSPPHSAGGLGEAPADDTLTLEQTWTGSKATVFPAARFLVRPREVSQAPAGWWGLHSGCCSPLLLLYLNKYPFCAVHVPSSRGRQPGRPAWWRSSWAAPSLGRLPAGGESSLALQPTHQSLDALQFAGRLFG